MNHLTLAEGVGEGWTIWKKYILQPPGKKRNFMHGSSEEKKSCLHGAAEKKILTNHRQPDPTCSLANLSIYMQALLFNSVKQGYVKK